jgi:hypothetical protein
LLAEISTFLDDYRDLFFESGSTEAKKNKKNNAKVCHLYI